MSNLKFYMSEQIRLQKEANQLAGGGSFLHKFLKTEKYKRLIAIEMELLQCEELITAILDLCYRCNPILKHAFADLIAPKVSKP